jgi:hypothetical protein
VIVEEFVVPCDETRSTDLVERVFLCTLRLNLRISSDPQSLIFDHNGVHLDFDQVVGIDQSAHLDHHHFPSSLGIVMTIWP